MKILIVDDEPLILAEIRATVASVVPEAELFAFSDAEEAMRLAETERFEIAFLDINMRFMDGVTMARALTERYPEINVIFCTGYAEYSLDAHSLYCSAYLLKPVTEEKVRDALEHLRHPIEKGLSPISIRCFGNFEVFYRGKPVDFRRKKAKEMLAYLVDRNGAECSPHEIMQALFNEENLNYYSVIRRELIVTMSSLDVPDVIRSGYGALSINREAVQCDYFDYLDGKRVAFYGEYMAQYPFGKMTCARLKRGN